MINVSFMCEELVRRANETLSISGDTTAADGGLPDVIQCEHVANAIHFNVLPTRLTDCYWIGTYGALVPLAEKTCAHHEGAEHSVMTRYDGDDYAMRITYNKGHECGCCDELTEREWLTKYASRSADGWWYVDVDDDDDDDDDDGEKVLEQGEPAVLGV
jgi:hypothetical protein